jgi:hypothetical protein
MGPPSGLSKGQTPGPIWAPAKMDPDGQHSSPSRVSGTYRPMPTLSRASPPILPALTAILLELMPRPQWSSCRAALGVSRAAPSMELMPRPHSGWRVPSAFTFWRASSSDPEYSVLTRSVEPSELAAPLTLAVHSCLLLPPPPPHSGGSPANPARQQAPPEPQKVGQAPPGGDGGAGGSGGSGGPTRGGGGGVGPGDLAPIGAGGEADTSSPA